MSKNKITEKNLQQLSSDIGIEFQNMSLLSLLKFGGQTLLAEAIRAEISDYLGRGFYQYSESKEGRKGYRHGIRKTTIDTPLGPICYDRPRINGAKDFRSQFHVP